MFRSKALLVSVALAGVAVAGPGFTVDFQVDASGKVTEAVLNQPNGVFHAKRK